MRSAVCAFAFALLATPWLGLFFDLTLFRTASLFSFLVFPVGSAIVAASLDRLPHRLAVALAATAASVALGVSFWASLAFAKDPTFENDELSALLLFATLVASFTLAPGLALILRSLARR